jgi:hypothetical protein
MLFCLCFFHCCMPVYGMLGPVESVNFEMLVLFHSKPPVAPHTVVLLCARR